MQKKLKMGKLLDDYQSYSIAKTIVNTDLRVSRQGPQIDEFFLVVFRLLVVDRRQFLAEAHPS